MESELAKFVRLLTEMATGVSLIQCKSNLDMLELTAMLSSCKFSHAVETARTKGTDIIAPFPTYRFRDIHYADLKSGLYKEIDHDCSVTDEQVFPLIQGFVLSAKSLKTDGLLLRDVLRRTREIAQRNNHQVIILTQDSNVSYQAVGELEVFVSNHNADDENTEFFVEKSRSLQLPERFQL